MLCFKFNGRLWGVTEDGLTPFFEEELPPRRRKINLLSVLGDREGLLLKLAFLLSAGQFLFLC